MFRIDQPGHVANKFVTGNPQAGQQATRMGAEWPNAVQEELCHVIEFAGLVLNKLDSTQLRQAIVALIAGVVGTGGGSVPTTRNVLGAGLVTGGGPLAADLTLTVPKASAAEVLAGANDTKAVTPLGLASAFARSLTSNGYCVIPFAGGFMLQWMSGTVTGNGTTILNLPTSFPTANFAAVCTGGNAVINAQDNSPFVSGRGVSNVSIFNAVDSSCSVDVIALGY
jgi:hypothetical protein